MAQMVNSGIHNTQPITTIHRNKHPHLRHRATSCCLITRRFLAPQAPHLLPSFLFRRWRREAIFSSHGIPRRGLIHAQDSRLTPDSSGGVSMGEAACWRGQLPRCGRGYFGVLYYEASCCEGGGRERNNSQAFYPVPFPAKYRRSTAKKSAQASSTVDGSDNFN